MGETEGFLIRVHPYSVCFPSVINTCNLLTGAPVVPPCSKCAPNPKNGKLSCCSPGGDWYQKCGDANDNGVDHTWTEGLEVCKGWTQSGGAKEQGMVRLETMELPLNTTGKENNFQQLEADAAVRIIHCYKFLDINTIASVFFIILQAHF